MCHRLAFLILVLFSFTTVRSEDDLELIKAKAAYEDAVAKQKDLLKAALEREVAKVVRTGKLDLVEEIKREQSKFLESDELPESSAMKDYVQKYKKAVESARERLESTYEKKITALTKASKLDEAKAVQSELKSIQSGSTVRKDSLSPEPVNEPEPQNEPAADDQQAISLVGAIWKQDGGIGTPGDQTFVATDLVRTELFSKGRFEINNGTLGNLDGRPATKSLFVEMQIFRNPVRLKLSEGSSISFGTVTPADARKPGFRMGNTRLELFEVLWKTQDGKQLTDRTAATTKLLQEGPLEIRDPAFPDFARGVPKLAVFRFRAGPQTVEFHATDYSTVIFPMNAAINYPNPWEILADQTPLKVGFRNVKWMLADGRDSSDVSQNAAALLNTRKTVACDQPTFGKVGQKKGPRVLDLDMVVNDAKFHLSLAEGSQLSIENATTEQLQKPGELIPGTPVVIVDVVWAQLNEMGWLTGPAMSQELWKHPCRIEPPIFEDKTNPGQVRKAIIRLRVGTRILKIAALTGSTFEIMSDSTTLPSAPSAGPTAAPVDILALIDPQQHQIVGEWKKRGRELVSPKIASAMLELPFQATPSYEMDFEVERVGTKVESFNIAFPIDGNWGMVVLDGYDGEASGLNLVNGQKALVNPNRYRKQVFRPGKNQIHLRVTPKTVVVEVNGISIVDWTGNPRSFSIEKYWVAGEGKAFIGAWYAEYIISRIDVRSL